MAAVKVRGQGHTVDNVIGFQDSFMKYIGKRNLKLQILNLRRL